MAFSAFRKTFWLLLGHNDKKGLASAHSVTGLSYYTCFKSRVVMKLFQVYQNLLALKNYSSVWNSFFVKLHTQKA